MIDKLFQKIKTGWNWTIDKLKRFWRFLIIGGAGIVLAASLVPTEIPQLPDLADQLDNAVKAKYSNAVEVLEKRTDRGKVYDLGNGQFLLRTTISKVHYKDRQGRLQNINLSQKNSDISGFENLIDEAPYKLYISDKGDRRIYPDRNKPEYINLPSPAFLNRTGKWVSNRELKWEDQNYDVSLLLAEDRIKFLAVIKKPVQFSSFSFPVQENGARLLDYLGGLQYWDSSPEPIVRDLAVNYQNSILTLSWDFAGMAYPIYVDPTFAVGASADDSIIYEPTSFSGTFTVLDCGAFVSPTLYNHSVSRFLSVNIPQGSTINSAYITYTARATSTNNNIQLKIAAGNEDNATQITSYNAFVGTATTTGIDWDMTGWASGTANNSPDISTEVQTVVNRAGWVSGNAINIFCFNDGPTGVSQRQLIASWDHTSSWATEPRLTITWTELAAEEEPPRGYLIE